MNYKDLKIDDTVIFKRYSDILKREDYQDGTILTMDFDKKEACILWLEGYQSRTDTIKFKDISAKPDIHGEPMKLGAFRGHFFILEDLEVCRGE